jgi:hypothetical protein
MSINSDEANSATPCWADQCSGFIFRPKRAIVQIHRNGIIIIDLGDAPCRLGDGIAHLLQDAIGSLSMIQRTSPPTKESPPCQE